MADEGVVVLEQADAQKGGEAPPIEEYKEINEDGSEEVAAPDIAPLDSEQDGESAKKPRFSKEQLLMASFLAGSVLFFLAVQLIALLFFVPTGDNSQQISTPEVAQKILVSPPSVQVFAPSKVDDMLAKADTLYQHGDKFEALKIYENIALYNKSLSNYNLGVSQMNQARFAEALDSFKKAIDDGDNISVSAINAAVCALEIGDKKLFKYYIELAGSYVGQDAQHAELYTYYEALINYYKQNYVEALRILDGHQGGYYAEPKRYLRAKILAFVNGDQEAIEGLLQTQDYDTSLPLGLLYARIGEYDKARRYLNQSLVNEKIAGQVELALELIDLKTGQYGSAANRLRYVAEANAPFITGGYPIKVQLSPELFDLKIAQKNFDIDALFNRSNIFAMLFYFTPYKVFDTKQTMTYIRKGGLSGFLDEYSAADSYLSASSTISKANLEISRAVALALNSRLREANKAFSDITKIYSGHSILHYNLALSYAQLGQFSDAYKHFVTSYHLDLNNHISGVYAILSAHLIDRDVKRLSAEVMENLANDKELKEGNFYNTLIQFAAGNSGVLQRWLDEEHEKTTLYMAFDVAAAYMIGQKELAGERTEALRELAPDDVFANMLYFTARFSGSTAEQYAAQIIERFLNTPLDRRSLYGSAASVKSHFVRLLQLAGLLNIERNRIKADLSVAVDNAVDILQMLAYIDLFTGHFEESFTIYNELISTHKIDDNRTLFLAAVAAVGAGHTESAIGYLELSRLSDPTSLEERLALGLLYQSAGNVDAAANQFSSIGNRGFLSEFFTFSVDR